MDEVSENIDIQILLATYNGEKYIAELLNSLLSQSYREWGLLVYDDGSSDGTLDIVKEYQEIHPNKITILTSSDANKGSTGSFYHLIDYATAKYVMFCDQDDIWLQDKIEVSVASIKELEKATGNELCLVFSDLRIVDEKLELISPSFWKFSKIDPNQSKRTESLVANSIVTGCTIILSTKIRTYLEIRPHFIQHDQWLSILVSHYGSISYVNKQLILYRQHSSNEVGSMRVDFRYLFVKAISIWKSILFIRRTCKELPFDVKFVHVLYHKLLFNFKRILT